MTLPLSNRARFSFSPQYSRHSFFALNSTLYEFCPAQQGFFLILQVPRKDPLPQSVTPGKA